MIAIKDKTTGLVILKFDKTEELAVMLTGITYMVVDGDPALGEILSLATTLAPIEVIQDMVKIYKEKRPNRAKDIEIAGNMLIAIKSTLESH